MGEVIRSDEVLYADRNVRIKALNVVGFIERKSFSDDGLMYHIAYYWNGERKQARVFRHELEPTDEPVGHGAQP